MKNSIWLFVFLLTISIINYPNPFNPKGGEIVTFECVPATSSEALLYVYDLSARLLFHKTFTDRTTWNGYSEANELVSNGIYLYRLIDSSTKKSMAKGKVWVINK
jgi:hypothetical protein